MKFTKVIVQVGLLCCLYFTGTWIQNTFHLPLPGSIIGMILLFLLLILRIIPLKWVDAGASSLIAFMPLLFIPMTVGVIQYHFLIGKEGFFILMIILMSTVIVMLSAAHIGQWIMGRKLKRKRRIHHYECSK